MKRTLLIFLVIAILLSTTAFAATKAQTSTADALNELGLFLGTGKGYELDSSLTRAQGMTLLVRMMGKEQEATSNTYTMPFTDVPDWATGYVGYAFANGITNGVSETKFDPDGVMTNYMFLTLVLRALGYRDVVWNKPYSLAQELGLVEHLFADDSFTRGDAVAVFWNALDAKPNGGQATLAQQLVQQGVFTRAQLEKARKTQKGETVNVTVSRPTVNDSDTETETPLIPNQTPWG